MAFLDEIDKLELSDEDKDILRREHQAEVDPLKEENGTLRRTTHKDKVEQEVVELSDLGFNEAPGLLKYVRRILLSDDQQPGAILLSDSDLGLSGDQATGANGKEEISVADAVRGFIERLPRNDEGRLAITLSDQLTGTDDDKPDDGEEDDQETKTKKHSSNLEKVTKRSHKRTRARYSRSVGSGGGD